MSEGKGPFNIFFSLRFYSIGGGIAGIFILSWILDINIQIPQVITFGFALVTLGELAALFANKKGVQSTRILPERFSNGDDNRVTILLNNHYPFQINLEIVEELPEQYEIRNNTFSLTLEPKQSLEKTYLIKPLQRGEYHFGFSRLFISSKLGLVKRRISSSEEGIVKVYPSFIQLRKYSLMAHTSDQSENGSKAQRRIGHSLEFEQIKEYVPGDDIRTLNWKATARRGGLMSNHYVDERSQQIFAIIDKGRLMKMPFEGLTLLDYAINATLVLANVCINKQDKFGLMTFSHKYGTVLPAQRSTLQMNTILETLYKQQTNFLESDFEKLYIQVRTHIRHRSFIILFTQFESMTGMKRQLPYLRQIAKHHLLLVVFFENSELKELTELPVNDLESIYTKTIAENFMHEKRTIVKELNNYGILSLLTPPEKLTVQAVNKYLEMKTKRAW